MCAMQTTRNDIVDFSMFALNLFSFHTVASTAEMCGLRRLNQIALGIVFFFSVCLPCALLVFIDLRSQIGRAKSNAC